MGQILIGSSFDPRDLQIKWGRDDVPRLVAQDLDANMHLFPRYVDAVKSAVGQSLTHPETKPVILTTQTMKDRLARCHELLLILRQEMPEKFSLRKCLDLLPKRFLESLLSGQRMEDAFERRDDKDNWVGNGPPEEMVIEATDLTEGAENASAGFEKAD